eukprot:sb/3465664/
MRLLGSWGGSMFDVSQLPSEHEIRLPPIHRTEPLLSPLLDRYQNLREVSLQLHRDRIERQVELSRDSPVNYYANYICREVDDMRREVKVVDQSTSPIKDFNDTSKKAGVVVIAKSGICQVSVDISSSESDPEINPPPGTLELPNNNVFVIDTNGRSSAQSPLYKMPGKYSLIVTPENDDVLDEGATSPAERSVEFLINQGIKIVTVASISDPPASPSPRVDTPPPDESSPTTLDEVSSNILTSSDEDSISPDIPAESPAMGPGYVDVKTKEGVRIGRVASVEPEPAEPVITERIRSDSVGSDMLPDNLRNIVTVQHSIVPGVGSDLIPCDMMPLSATSHLSQSKESVATLESNETMETVISAETPDVADVTRWCCYDVTR